MSVVAGTIYRIVKDVEKKVDNDVEKNNTLMTGRRGTPGKKTNTDRVSEEKVNVIILLRGGGEGGGRKFD